MKFKKGDTILLRGVISEIHNKYTYFIRFDGSTGNTYLNEQEIEAGVPYPADIPLPNQEVWVRNDDNKKWEHAMYLYCHDKCDISNTHHVAYHHNGYVSVYAYVTTDNPYKGDSIDLQKGKYSLETLKNLILEHEKEQ